MLIFLVAVVDGMVLTPYDRYNYVTQGASILTRAAAREIGRLPGSALLEVQLP
mgnify:CR=1 FL=1